MNLARTPLPVPFSPVIRTLASDLAAALAGTSPPDDGFADASDPQSDLLGNINRIYGVPGRVEPGRKYRGTYGFITD